jgi:protein-disulfide isomerase
MKRTELLVGLVIGLSALSWAMSQSSEMTLKPGTSFYQRLTADPSSPVLGNPRGSITVVEFFDYRCPYCRSMAPQLRTLLSHDSDVRLVLKEWPILSEGSRAAARVAIVANWQGKYGAVHEALLRAPRTLEEPQIRAAASEAGVDLPQLDRDLRDRAADIDRILGNVEAEAQALGVRGTPVLIVGTEVNVGALSLDDLKFKIAAQRKAHAP